MRDLTVRYGAITAVRAATIDLAPGTVAAVVGPNGAGKTSLFAGIAGAVDATGTVALDGERIDALPAESRTRAGIAMIPAGRRVFGNLSVEHNLVVGATALPRDRVRARMAAIVERFPLLADRLGQRAATLSGGEAQILTIARALVAEPRVLLVDEPFQGLSPEARAIVLGALFGVADEGAAVLIATPDPIDGVPLIEMRHGQLGVRV